MMEVSGAKLVIELLKSHGVDTVFGYPGGAILPFYDELYHHKDIRHILVRHEQGAIHMAEGYAKSTGKIGVVVVTSGPGATNVLTGICDASMDSVPILIISGQVNSQVIGSDAFQEADIFGLTLPITKYNALLTDVDKIAECFEEAWYLAHHGKPGPVVLDFPKDIQSAKTKILQAKPQIASRFFATDDREYSKEKLEQCAQIINQAKRPLFLVGGGAINAGCAKEIQQCAEKIMSPVTCTLMGLGAFPGNHLLSLGMPGMHGTAAANHAILQCDVIVSLGARFDDRVAGDAKQFAAQAKRIHLDIDRTQINKRVFVDHYLLGDLKDVLRMLTPYLQKKDRNEWIQYLEKYKDDNPLEYGQDEKNLYPQSLLQNLYEKTNGEAIITTDVGQHQMWAAQYYLFAKPRCWLTSGGLGTMGFGLPAAIGAQIAHPERLVICITGDGSYQMCIQELATIRQYNLPVKVLLINNNFLGMVRQWQELFFSERYSESEWEYNPDFVMLAESYGIPAKKISENSELADGLDFFLSDRKQPAFLEALIPKDEKVFPMISAGQDQKSMIQYKNIKDSFKSPQKKDK